MEMKDTLNLPNTDFPMKANLTQREPELLARWEKEKLYEKSASLPGVNPNLFFMMGRPMPTVISTLAMR